MKKAIKYTKAIIRKIIGHSDISANKTNKIIEEKYYVKEKVKLNIGGGIV